MKLQGLLLLAAFGLSSCITTEAERKNFKVESTDTISMDIPDQPEALSDNNSGGFSPYDMVIVEDGVKLRKSPSDSAKALKTLKKWEEVVVVEVKGDWSRLKQKGWVKSEQLGE